MEHFKDYRSFTLRIAADIITITFSWFFSYYLRFYVIPGGIGKPLGEFIRIWLIVIVLFLFFNNRNGLYSSMRNLSWVHETNRILLSVFQSLLTLVIILYFLFPKRVSRVTLTLFFVTVLLMVIMERFLITTFLNYIRSKGRNLKHVLLVGYGEGLEKYVNTYQNPQFGINFIGQITEDYSKKIKGVRIIKGDLIDTLNTHNPDMVVISYPSTHQELSQKHIQECYDKSPMLNVILDSDLSYIGSQLMLLNGQHIMVVNHPSLSNFDRIIKRTFDFFFSLIGIVLLSPVLILIALGIKLTSRGPVFYKQDRITEGNRVFHMMKFRSMKQNSKSKQNGTGAWTTPNDSRVTKFGKFLRKTSLDELPQLFNVLGGSMSLIGPRPERPELVKQFNEEIDNYRLRHKVKTGMSGWAQVNGWRGNTSLTKRVEADLYYIQNWSILLDLKIIFLTFIKGFINKNAY